MKSGPVRPEVIAALTQTPTVKRQVRTVANEIRKRARRRAIKVTGAMRRSLAVENVLDPETGQVEFRVGWDKRIAFWGPLVELGTEDTPARPHLRPAADEVRGSIS